MEEFERQTETGKHRMMSEFRTGLRDKKTGVPHNQYKSQIEEAEKIERKEFVDRQEKKVSRPKPRPTMKNKEIKA